MKLTRLKIGWSLEKGIRKVNQEKLIAIEFINYAKRIKTTPAINFRR